MGMRDQSWCDGCGAGVPFSGEGGHYCEECSADNVTQDLLSFVTGRIEALTEMREEAQKAEDWEIDDYTAGAIDAYDIIRMKLTK